MIFCCQWLNCFLLLNSIITYILALNKASCFSRSSTLIGTSGEALWSHSGPKCPYLWYFGPLTITRWNFSLIKDLRIQPVVYLGVCFDSDYLISHAFDLILIESHSALSLKWASLLIPQLRSFLFSLYTLSKNSNDQKHHSWFDVVCTEPVTLDTSNQCVILFSLILGWHQGSGQECMEN